MKTLSDDAREVALSMIAHCISSGYCMGMGEGFNNDGNKEAFRVELEALVECKDENVAILYK